MKRRFLCQTLLIVILFTIGITSRAATFESRTSGNWGDATTWTFTGTDGDGIPDSDDIVRINTGHTIIVNISNGSCSTLEIGTIGSANNTAILTFNSNSILTVTTSVTIGSGQKKGSVSMMNGGLFRIGGTFTVSSLDTWTYGIGTIDYYSNGNQTVYSNSYYNLTLSGSGIKTTTGVIVNGLLSMEGTATASAVPTYGSLATLQYNTSTSRSTGPEWPATFSGTGGVVIRNTGTITLAADKIFSGNPLEVFDGSSLSTGSYTLSTPNALNLYCGGATTGSTISGNGILTLGGNVNVIYAGYGTAGATISCPVELGAARIFTVADGGSDPAIDLTISGIISGTGFGITKAGAGTMFMSGLNSFTGAVTINAGVLSIDNMANTGSNSALGTGFSTGASAISIAGAGTLRYTGTGHSTNRPITLTGDGARIDASGSESGIMTLTGTISGYFNLELTGTTLGVASGNITTGAGTVTKTGSGTWTLTGNSTYTGLTTISSGTLRLGGGETSNPLGTPFPGTVVNDGATLDLSGFTTEELFTLNGSGVDGLGALINSSNESVIYGTIELGGSSTIGGSGNITFSGVISGLGFSMTKLGTNTINLSADNTFTGGLIINNGVVLMAYPGCLADNLPLTLNGGVLSTGGENFDETLGILTLSANSEIALGEGVHSLTFANSSGANWTGLLTITGWTGNGLTGGTAGKIFVGTGGLTTTQLSQVSFTGFDPGANLLGGEVVPPYQHLTGDYRSVSSGSWEILGTWEYYDGSLWSTPTNLPSEASLVQILNGHIITIDAFAEATNVIIESGSTLTVTNSGQGTFGTITNFGTLNLNSDEYGIFSLIVDTYSDYGTENIQLYLTGGGDDTNYPWHYVSTPVAGLSTSYIMTGGGEDGSDLAEYVEPLVATNLSQHAAWMGFDGWNYQSIDGSPSGDGFTELALGKGYNYYSYDHAKRVLNGTFNTQDVLSIALSNSDTGDIYGWNLVGNPFTASIDWDNIVRDGNVDNAIYFTTNNTTASYVGGIGVPEGTTGLIPPMQGFFVKSNGIEDYINFSTADRTHSGQNRYKGNAESIPLIRLKLVSQNVADETVIRFDKSANFDFDHNLDAYKFSKTGTKVSLWSNSDKISYSINSIPYPENEIEIPLGINVATEGSYKLNATQLQDLGDYGIYLTDKSNGTTVNLNTTPEFSFSSPAGKNENRFSIKIIAKTTGIEKQKTLENDFNIYASNGYVNIQTLSDDWNGKTGTAVLIDMTGRIITLKDNVEFWKDSLIQIPSEKNRGLYLIRLESGLNKFVGRVMIK